MIVDLLQLTMLMFVDPPINNTPIPLPPKKNIYITVDSFLGLSMTFCSILFDLIQLIYLQDCRPIHYSHYNANMEILHSNI